MSGAARWLAGSMIVVGLMGCSRGRDIDDVFGGQPVSTTLGIDLDDGSSGDAADDDNDDDDDDGTEDTGDGDGRDGVPAEGIAVDSIVFNQGVAVEVVRDGALVSPAERNAPLVHGRRTMVHVKWALDDDFRSRPIRADLVLQHPGGETSVSSTTVDISGPSGPLPTDPHFEFILPAEDLVPGTTFAVELLEEDGVDAEPTTQDSRFPSSGTADLALPASDQRIEIVVVPYRSTYAGCNQVAPSDEATIEMLHGYMLATNPVQSVEITVHEEVAYAQSMMDLDAVVIHLGEIRAEEQPSPHVFYYALAMPCEEPDYGGWGYMPWDPTDPNEGESRIAVGLYWAEEPKWAGEIMIHEVGHNQGRAHVLCSGDEQGVDTSYPYDAGQIDGWGFDVRDDSTRPSTHADYMSYCWEIWVSDYTWRATFEVVDALTAYGGSGAPVEPRDAIRIARGPDGRVYTGRSRSSSQRAEMQLPIFDRGAQIGWAPARVDLTPDSPMQHLTILVPPEHAHRELQARWDETGPHLSVRH